MIHPRRRKKTITTKYQYLLLPLPPCQVPPHTIRQVPPHTRYHHIPFTRYHHIPFARCHQAPFARYHQAPFARYHQTPFARYHQAPFARYHQEPFARYHQAPFARVSERSTSATKTLQCLRVFSPQNAGLFWRNRLWQTGHKGALWKNNESEIQTSYVGIGDDNNKTNKQQQQTSNSIYTGLEQAFTGSY